MNTPLSPSPYTKFRSLALGLAVAAAAVGMTPQPAQALTLILDFTQVNITENSGIAPPATIGPADFGSWGFTGMNLGQIKSSVLASVNTAYLAYPTMSANALSPLPNGQRLNISFELGTFGVAPSNGDSNYFYFGVGATTGGGETELGHACYGCVRDLSMTSSVAAGTLVGVNFTDNLQGLTSLATTDSERINILAGTIAHEFGHALLLDHPVTITGGLFDNPGASSFSIMATGAAPSNMPNEERLKARAFSYAEFGTLIQTVGTVPITPVPEPSALALLLAGLGTVVVVARRKRMVAGTASA